MHSLTGLYVLPSLQLLSLLQYRSVQSVSPHTQTLWRAWTAHHWVSGERVIWICEAYATLGSGAANNNGWWALIVVHLSPAPYTLRLPEYSFQLRRDAWCREILDTCTDTYLSSSQYHVEPEIRSSTTARKLVYPLFCTQLSSFIKIGLLKT